MNRVVLLCELQQAVTGEKGLNVFNPESEISAHASTIWRLELSAHQYANLQHVRLFSADYGGNKLSRQKERKQFYLPSLGRF